MMSGEAKRRSENGVEIVELSRNERCKYMNITNGNGRYDLRSDAVVTSIAFFIIRKIDIYTSIPLITYQSLPHGTRH